MKTGSNLVLKTSKVALHRRTLLQGLGLGAAAQFLPTLRPSYAAGQIPTRLVIMYSMHGTLPWLWLPTGPNGSGTPTTTSWDFGPMLTPLAPYKADVNLLSGIDSKALDGDGSMGNCGHSTGQMGSLTANKQTGQKTSAGPSFDQFIQEELKKSNGGQYPTALPSMQLGILDKIPNLSLWGQPYLQQTSAGVKPLPITYSPSAAFSKAFPNGATGGGGGGGGGDATAAAKRKSVLDFAISEFGKVGDKLGKFEQQRLQAHADKIRDLEKSIAMMPTGGGGGSCTANGTYTANTGQSGWYANTLDAMPRMMQALFACDVTRIVCLQCEEPAPSSYGYTPGSFGTTDLHDLVHKLDVGMKDKNDADRLGVAKKFYLEYANTFARVLKLLTELKEADGKPMLYHTVVLWAGEIAQPGHSHFNYKWVLAGQGGGYFKTGQYLNWDGDGVEWGPVASNPSNGDLFTSIANAMGVNATSFGPASKGPIAALKA